MNNTKSLPLLKLGLFVIFLGSLIACDHSDEVPPITSNNVNDFIWKGLNSWYYWQSDVPNLENSLYTQPSYIDFVRSQPNSADFFYSLLNNYPNTDRFSWIVEDYNALLSGFQGTNNSFGFELGLVRISESDSILGYVKYVLPNSLAEQEGIARGDFFAKVNGTQLTTNNYVDLIFGTSNFEFELLDYVDGNFVETGVMKNVTQEVLTENPVFYKNVYEVNGKRVGYLVYNAFTYTFNAELNDAFAYFKSENISDLILDVRYNSGGRLETATYLASMIKGSNDNSVFAELRYNEKRSHENESYHFTDEMRTFNASGDYSGNEMINAVNLNSLVVLTTYSTASASELVMNGLKNEIPLLQIGTTTRGKDVGSVTLFDSPAYDYRSLKYANPGHTWAMQPIVFKTYNGDGESDYSNGFTPQIVLNELDFPGNFPNLGDPEEPLLAAALAFYEDGRPPQLPTNNIVLKSIATEHLLFPMKDQMHLQPQD